MKQFLFTKKAHRQQGISLFIVIVLVMLSMLLALWSSRSAIFNEMIVGNDADYQRAFEAAQALIQDAELDIRGEQPDGTACVPISGNTDVCRPVGSAVFFPNEDKELAQLTTQLAATSGSEFCFKGICLKRTGNQDFWNDATTLDAMITQGARYGQFSGAQTGGTATTSSNPILKDATTGRGGWYWVEVMPYDPAAGNSGLVTNGSTNLPLNIKPNVVYRISAVARGLKPSTQVVLQSTYVRQKLKN